MAEVCIANIEEIRQIIALAKEYDGGFSAHVKVDVNYAIEKYTKLVTSGIAVVFALKSGGDIVGGLAALKAEDLNYPRSMGVELFWFVIPGHRGEGMKLFRAYEDWCNNSGCDIAAMIHLEDSYPDRLKRLYKKKGYTLTELHYVKEVRR